MLKPLAHHRVLAFPVEETPAGGLLEALQLENHRGRTDLLFDYHALKLTIPSQLYERDGRLWERICGHYVPRRLRFTDVKFKQGESVPANLVELPPQDPERLIYAVMAWRSKDRDNFYLFDLYSKKDDTLLLTAKDCFQEDHPGPLWEADFERSWSPPPLHPARLIPAPLRLHRRFGGDPVTVRLDGRNQPLRLFIGGLDTQSNLRPDVSAVLNLSEYASLWSAEAPAFPGDRWAQKGEGSHGMTPRDLADEAGWVVDHLKKGERVLVHCSAGMNRSGSVCCAVLILLEGLSAEAALERVREHHPWVRPDPRHWLALRWLASTM